MKNKLLLLIFYLFINFALILDNFDFEWSPSPGLFASRIPYCFVATGPNIITGIHLSSNDNYLSKNNLKFRLKPKKELSRVFGIGSLIKQETSKKIPEKFSLSQNYPSVINPAEIINSDVAKSKRVGLKFYNIRGREATEFVNENFFREIIL